MSDQELRRAYDESVYRARQRKYKYGILGKPDGTVAVAGQTGYVWVRMDTDRSLATALNPNAVAQSFNLPVKMEEDKNRLVIIGLNTGGESTASGGVVSNPYGVNKHNHRLESGLEYEIEPERLEQGRVYPAGGLTVGVRGFRYFYNGGWQTFQGGTVSMGPHRPATTGKHRWVLIGIDPAANDIVVEDGAFYDYATDLSVGLIDAITFTGYIPCGAVKVRNDDTAVTDITKYQDAHGWFEVPVIPDDWHTHLMSVDAGTRTIDGGYSLIVPDFEIPTGMALEIAEGGILMVIG